jgi:hypothetical protein
VSAIADIALLRELRRFGERVRPSGEMVAVAGPVDQVDAVLLLVRERSLRRNARPATEEGQEPTPQLHC